MKFYSFFKSVIVGLPIGLTFIDIVGYVARVDGISMQPALNPDRARADYVFLNRFILRSSEIRRGDIISLISPKDPSQKIIKRVVGIEGIIGRMNVFYKKVTTVFLGDIISTLSYKNDIVKVPEGHCWIEGDHIGHSMDSNNFGPVSLGLVTAKATCIVWPPSRWQLIEPFVPHSRLPLNLLPKSFLKFS